MEKELNSLDVTSIIDNVVQLETKYADYETQTIEVQKSYLDEINDIINKLKEVEDNLKIRPASGLRLNSSNLLRKLTGSFYTLKYEIERIVKAKKLEEQTKLKKIKGISNLFPE